MSYLETLPKVQDLINSLLIVLSEKEKFIIENRFSLNDHPRMTLEKIGEKYDVTRERIRQIEKNALRKLERNVNNTQLREITSLALSVLEQSGGLASEDSLANSILNLVEDPSQVDVNSLKLTIDLDKSITHEHNTIRFRPYWRLSHVKPTIVKKSCELIAKELKKAGKVLNYTKLASFCREKISSEGINENFIKAAAGLDRELKAVDEGVGLAAWREINPKTLRDKIFFIFNQTRKPLHYIDIANMIGDMSFDRKSVNTQAVHNELIRYPEFILIGRGIYALKEWGFEEGTVAEVIEKVLAENGELTRDEVIQKVLERRHVKKITILLNLKNKEQFVKVGKDRFRLEK